MLFNRCTGFNTFLLGFMVFCFYQNSVAQETFVYKQIDGFQLCMEMHKPPGWSPSNTYPALLFFFGGGWTKGSMKQFEPHAKYFSKRGVVCFLVDYRVESRHKSSIFQSVQDAKSALRYIKEHANDLGIDPSKVIASGGSAGGHLAAASALINDYNEITDDLEISCKPNALVLFNPAIDNGPAGVGYPKVKESFSSISPLHNIRAGAPPTLIFLGTHDSLVPVETAKYYEMAMKKTGNECKLILYEGEEHGFFNYTNFENYKSTLLEMDAFLQSLGYLKDIPKVVID